MRGYNKDGHRECKQLVLGAVTRPDGIPIWVDVNDGNLNDTVWNRQVLASLQGAFTARPDILFVADSKLIADKTVDHLCQEKIHFVSRMPNTYGLTATTKDAAAQHGTWTEPGVIAQRDGAAYYRIWETSGVVATHTVRLVVVESSALRAKADARIAQDLETAAKRVDNAGKRLGHQRFASEAEAHQALESWKKTLSALDWWAVEAVLHTATRRRRRPEGGPLVTVTEWFWTIQRGAPRQTFVDREHLRRRTFVLISNDPQRSAAELLAAYNEEWVVEGTHSTLKGPVSIAPVFLKDPRKLTAYVYVVYMAVLLWSVMQAVARRNALKWQVSLPYPNGKLQDAPSTKRIKELLTPVAISCYRVGNTTHRALGELTWVQRLACLLLEIEPRRLAAVPSG
jgi:transposase